MDGWKYLEQRPEAFSAQVSLDGGVACFVVEGEAGGIVLGDKEASEDCLGGWVGEWVV